MIRVTTIQAFALAVVMSLAACSSDTGGTADCLAAFREAVPRAEPPYGVSPLDDAIRKCESFADWRAAWEAVPEAHPEGSTVRGVLLERCAEPELSFTAVCREVDGQT